ncbi:MAG: SiaC family regulatory phosphoprotein [Bacteroidales bacterium]|nr:SiaC family regulatory phosphoprotein [Bacteroidales bacterium]
MEDLMIQGDSANPTVIFKTSGEIKFEGRALPENAIKFFQPLKEWAANIDVKEIKIEFNLDYFNTSVSKQLLDLFRDFENNPRIEKIFMNWMYEDGDDEMLESGEIYEEMLKRFTFSYQKYAEIIE